MPRIGKNKGGPPKAAEKGSKGQGPSMRMSRKGPARNRKGAPVDPEDMPLSPDTMYDGDVLEESQRPSVAPAEPFIDGIVSPRLRGLAVIPRAGGEEAALLHDFLYLFAKTETFIGAISSKTSFMKKAGGRLL